MNIMKITQICNLSIRCEMQQLIELICEKIEEIESNAIQLPNKGLEQITNALSFQIKLFRLKKYGKD